MEDLYLQHHGILGQKWGVRRYQNKDGTLTSEGKARRLKDGNQKISLTPEQRAKIKKGVIIGATAVGTGLAVYGLYKTGQLGKAAKVGKAAVEKMMNGGKQLNPFFVGPRTKTVTATAQGISKATKGLGKGIKKGLMIGPEQMGEQIGKVVTGGITALAVKELADIVVGENTTKLVMDAYNSHQKKENKVKSPNAGLKNRSKDTDND